LSLLATVPVARFASSLPENHAIVRASARETRTVERCIAGGHWTWDGVDFAILHPVPANYVNPKLKTNDLSCVVMVRAASGSALLTGDIEARTEADLVRREGAALHANLLVVPHHGSRTSSTPAFIAAVGPDVAVFTPGYRNRFGHPRPEIVERYAAARIPTYRTDYEGALTFSVEPGTSFLPRRERETDRRYWWDEPAGSSAPTLPTRAAR
jgi:competence protein ComEC